MLTLTADVELTAAEALRWRLTGRLTGLETLTSGVLLSVGEKKNKMSRARAALGRDRSLVSRCADRWASHCASAVFVSSNRTCSIKGRTGKKKRLTEKKEITAVLCLGRDGVVPSGF